MSLSRPRPDPSVATAPFQRSHSAAPASLKRSYTSVAAELQLYPQLTCTCLTA